MLRFYDLFSGVGGFHVGLQKASREFECVGASEIDRYAAQIYEKHFGINPLGDATKVDVSGLPDFDILCAGFPCQPFSYAGKRQGFSDEKNGNLFQDAIVRITKIKRPSYLFLENVRGLLSNDRGRTFAKILYTLDELGYDAEWQCINAKHFVPQSRERVFIIGHLRTGGQNRKQILPITEACRLDNGEVSEKQEGESRVQESHIANCIDAHYCKTSGGSRTLLMIMTAHTKANIKQRIHRRDDVWAIDTSSYNSKMGVSVDDGKRVRRFTPLEVERLMGFEDGWTEGIPETQRYRCLGNAVVPHVVSYIAKRLIQQTEREFDQNQVS